MAPLWSSADVIDLTGDDEDEDESRDPQKVPVPVPEPLQSAIHSDAVEAQTQHLLLEAADQFRRLSSESQSYIKAELVKRAGTKQENNARKSIIDLLSTAPCITKERDGNDKTASRDGNAYTRKQLMAMGRVERNRKGRFATGDSFRRTITPEEDIEQSAVAALSTFQNGTLLKVENVVPNGPTKAGPFDLSQIRSTKSLKRTADGEFKYDITERPLSAAASPSAKSTAPSVSTSDERARETINNMHRKHTRRRTPASKEKPYLRMSERSFLRSSLLTGEWDNQTLASWEGTVLHNDFDIEEKHAIWDSIRSVLSMRKSSGDQFSGVPWDQVKTHLDSIVQRAQSKSSLRRRSRSCIEGFLKDLSSDPATATRSQKQLIIKEIDSPQKKTPVVGHFLRSRELGISRRSGKDRTTLGAPIELQNRVYDTMGPSFTFTGTSGDVGTVAWSPDGSHFAAGSIALMDSSSMQYNQPNNLLLGNIARNSLRELPEHNIERKKPSKGINATEAMHRSQDPVIFTTVSVVKFSQDNHFMYSTGYDHNLRAWDLHAGSKKNSCLWSFPHKAVINLLTVGENGIVATGSQRASKNSIKVLKCDQDGDGAIAVHAFQSSKAAEKPDSKTFPSSLTLGSGWSRNRLLAGFSSNIAGNAGNYTSGETCLWDIETGQQIAVHRNTRNVFDCVWHPNNVTFGVGSLAGGGVNRGTRSVVRLYDPRMEAQRCTKYMDKFELECPAYDMNDIVFSRYDDNIVSASCTSGQSFVWDIRNPDEILHTLTHGDPLIELPGHDIREKEDTGIRFASFGHSPNRLYTGSSDGIVKSWDIYRSPEDVWVRDVISCKSGIMSGAFSPDFSNLLLGEVNGTINLLSVGREDMSVKDAEPLHLERASKQPHTSTSAPSSTEDDETTLGIRTANAFLASGEILLRPLGCLPLRQAVQGPKYTGPFYKDPVEAAPLRAQAAAFQKKFQIADKPCTIDHSADYSKITEEDRGDSGTSRDRIPHALRWPLWEENRKGKTAKCFSCGLPAKPSEEGHAVCERCRLTCFKCGHTTWPVGWEDQDNFIDCLWCGRIWRIDCLGFTPVDRRTRAEIPVSFPSGDSEVGRLEEERNVEWYYHSRWET